MISETLQGLQDQAALVEKLQQEIAERDAHRDRKVHAQGKEIARLLALEKSLRQELAEALAMAAGSDTYKDRQRNGVTIAIQKRAIQERQDYIDEVKATMRSLLSKGDATI